MTPRVIICKWNDICRSRLDQPVNIQVRIDPSFSQTSRVQGTARDEWGQSVWVTRNSIVIFCLLAGLRTVNSYPSFQRLFTFQNCPSVMI